MLRTCMGWGSPQFEMKDQGNVLQKLDKSQIGNRWVGQTIGAR